MIGATLSTRDEQSLTRMREQRRRDIETIAALERKIVRLQAQVVLVAAQPEHNCELPIGGAEVARAARILADALEPRRRP